MAVGSRRLALADPAHPMPIGYLQAAKDAGAYACMALGAEAALSALALWELL